MAARVPLARRSIMPTDFIWFLPDWAPNLHPILVHFPISLLVSAVSFDLLAFALSRQSSCMNIATGFYVLGTISLIAAYLSGREAAITVFTPGMAHGLVDKHWTFALWSLVYFSSLMVARIVLHRRLYNERQALWSFFLITGAGGLVLLLATTGYGSRLVYEYGVGVLGVR